MKIFIEDSGAKDALIRCNDMYEMSQEAEVELDLD